MHQTYFPPLFKHKKIIASHFSNQMYVFVSWADIEHWADNASEIQKNATQ